MHHHYLDWIASKWYYYVDFHLRGVEVVDDYMDDFDEYLERVGYWYDGPLGVLSGGYPWHS